MCAVVSNHVWTLSRAFPDGRPSDHSPFMEACTNAVKVTDASLIGIRITIR